MTKPDSTLVGDRTYLVRDHKNTTDFYVISGGAGYLWNRPALDVMRRNSTNATMPCPGTFYGQSAGDLGEKLAFDDFEDTCFSSFVHNIGIDATATHRMFWLFEYEREIVTNYRDRFCHPSFKTPVTLPITRHHVNARDGDLLYYGLNPRLIPSVIVTISQAHAASCLGALGFEVHVWDSEEKIWEVANTRFVLGSAKKRKLIPPEVSSQPEVMKLMAFYATGGILLNQTVQCRRDSSLHTLTFWARENELDFAYHVDNRSGAVDLIMAVRRSEILHLVLRQLLHFIANGSAFKTLLDAIRFVETTFGAWHGDKIREISDSFHRHFVVP